MVCSGGFESLDHQYYPRVIYHVRLIYVECSWWKLIFCLWLCIFFFLNKSIWLNRKHGVFTSLFLSGKKHFGLFITGALCCTFLWFILWISQVYLLEIFSCLNLIFLYNSTIGIILVFHTLHCTVFDWWYDIHLFSMQSGLIFITI